MLGKNLFEVIVTGGGFIGYIIWALSIVTVALLVKYATAIRRTTIMPELVLDEIKTLFEQKQYRQAIERTAEEPSFLSHIVHAGLSQAAHGYSAMERALEEATEERTTKLLRKIELLNIIGNVSPMMGLLGTVYGMIKVFSKIVEQKGMPNPAELAGGVGTALVTTFWGLIVAIPALAVYAVMRNRIDALASEATMIGQEIISTFRPGARKPAGGEPANSAGS